MPAPSRIAPAALPGDRSRGPARYVAGAVLAILLAIQVSQGARVASLPGIQVVSWNVIIDDGFYYLQVARNIARGHGSTFDRLNGTNGYQPLWALMLVPIFWFTDDAAAGMRAALVLATAIAALSLLLLYAGLQRLLGLGAALLACSLVVANPYFLQIAQGGLETPALFLCLAALLAFWAYRGEQVLRSERRPCLLLGALLGLTVLARTDVLIVLLPFGLALLLPSATRPLRDRLRRALWVALPVALLILPFVAWSYFTQGSPVPVSGLVKRWAAATFTPTRQLWEVTEQWRGLTRTLHLMAWPHKVVTPEDMSQTRPALFYVGGLLLFLLLRLGWSRRARENRLAALMLVSFVVGTAAHALYLFYVYRSTGHWNYHYFFPAALLFTVLAAVSLPLLVADLGLLLDRLLGGRLRPGLAALGAALALPGVWALVERGLPAFEERYRELQQPAARSFRKSRWDAAEHMRRAYPHDEVFGSWWAGTLGYLSDRRVVNLDGVINSGAFFRDVLRRDAVPRYLVEGPVRHLVDFFWRNPLVGAPAPRVFWWEHEKEHVVARLRPRLRIATTLPFQGDAAMYILDLPPK